MYCIYDDFGPIDTEGWAAYYKSKGPRPTYNPNFKGDICGIVEALDKAAADPEVKNFVLDLTCNSGGEAGVLAAITTLLAGKSSIAFENVLTKQRGVAQHRHPDQPLGLLMRQPSAVADEGLWLSDYRREVGWRLLLDPEDVYARGPLLPAVLIAYATYQQSWREHRQGCRASHRPGGEKG